MFLSIAILVLGAVFWSPQYSSPTRQSERARDGSKKSDDGQENEGLLNWLTTDAGGFFTFWLVVVGGGQLVLFYVQLRLIRESLSPAKDAGEAAKESARAAHRAIDESAKRDHILERAYLWSGPGHTERTQLNRVRFFITVHNTGKTVGIMTDIYYVLSTEEEFKAGVFKFEHIHREEVIWLDNKFILRTAASRELIGKGSKILHGYILYRDIFGETHKCPWKHWVYPDGNSDPLTGCYTEWT
jgi:hypothetical protein